MAGRRRVLNLPAQRSRALDREIQEEVRAHLELAIERFVAEGFSRDEAERQARARFGELDHELVRLRASARLRDRRVRRRERFAALRQDVRFAVRRIRADIRLTSVIVLVLALAIGANAAAFSVADQLLIAAPSNPPAADRIGRLSFEDGEDRSSFASLPLYRALSPPNALSVVAAYTVPYQIEYRYGDETGSLRLAGATRSLFELLDARPAIGRSFSSLEDSIAGGGRAAVVSEAFWRGHALALGRKLRIGQDDFTIVGVARRGYVGAEITKVDVWVPLEAALRLEFPSDYRQPDFRIVRFVGRLRDGASWTDAEQALSTAYRAAMRIAGVEFSAAARVRLRSIVPRNSDDWKLIANTSLLVILVAAGVMLIACTNVATLLAARDAPRRREIALRFALGVTRRRLVQQCLAESGVIVITALAVAVPIEFVTQRLIYSFLLPDIAQSNTGGQRLALAMAVMALVAAFATSLPRLLSTLSTQAKDVASDALITPSQPTVRRALLAVVQLSFAVVLIVAAALFTRSVRQLNGLPLGFDAQHLVVAQADLPDSASAEDIVEYWTTAAQAIGALPQVQAVTIATSVPYAPALAAAVQSASLDGAPSQPEIGAFITAVDTAYLSTIGARLVAGRFFGAADSMAAPPVAIINQRLAERLWAGDVSVGKTIAIEGEPSPVEVVGVMSDLLDWSILQAAHPRILLPRRQWRRRLGARGYDRLALLARVQTDPARVSTVIAAALPRTAGGTRSALVQPLNIALQRQRRGWVFAARLLVPLALLALFIALVGTYALLEYSVAQRRIEWSIRAAMGASPWAIIAVVLRQGGALAGGGILTGLMVAAALTPRLRPLLFGVRPHDLVAYLAALALTSVALICAVVLPAHRAASTNPAAALRSP